jgi:signal transduction histidine kinase
LLPPLVPKVTALIRAAKVSEERKTALEQKNEELALANEELRAFTYSASHDLRAPLRTMSSMSALLRESLASSASPDAKLFSERIEQGAERMNQLLDDLLAYTGFYRLDAPVTTIAPGPVIMEVLRELEADIRTREATVRVSDQIPAIAANRSMLKLILANLIGNAIRYVPRGRNPEVRIEATTVGPWVEISVFDNGCGIPAQYQQKIFEPFERLHRAEDVPGTGLGLAIVKRAVQKLRGEVGVESGTNEGSRFWVRLPKG